MLMKGPRRDETCMTKPKVEIEGEKELQGKLKKLAKKYGEAVVKGAIKGAQKVRSDAIMSIQEQSGGEQVTRSRLGGGPYDHTTSKPGDAPNTDTGRLVQSIQVEIQRNAVFVGSTLDYASWLEFGTKKMDARPWLFPALEKNRKFIETAIGRQLQIESKKADIL